MLVIYPLVLGVFFLAGGILLLRHEGVNPRNIPSVGFAMMLLAFNIVIPLIFNVGSSGTLTYLYWYLTFVSAMYKGNIAEYIIMNSGLFDSNSDEEVRNLMRFKNRTRELFFGTVHKITQLRAKEKAGDGNRTHVTSLEGWCSTIEPRLRETSLILQGFYQFVKKKLICHFIGPFPSAS